MSIFRSPPPFADIKKVTLTQATYNQPVSAMLAYSQYREQLKDMPEGVKLSLIIVDSTDSERVAPAREFYERHVNDPNVIYVHMPIRPGLESKISVQDRTLFPKAYQYLEPGTKAAAVFIDKVPTADVVISRWKDEEYLHCAGDFDPRAYTHVTKNPSEYGNKELVALDEWEKFVQKMEVQDRPHLGSARNFSTELAGRQFGSDAMVHLDDDKLGRGYVAAQIKNLRQSHFTAPHEIPTLIYTPQMAGKNLEPRWGVTDLHHTGEAIIIDHHGGETTGVVSKRQPQGFCYAYRRWNGMPQVPDVLGGEDQFFLKRLFKGGATPKVEGHGKIVRLVFGASNSRNTLRHLCPEGHHHLPHPVERHAAYRYLSQIVRDFGEFKGESIEALSKTQDFQKVKAHVDVLYNDSSRPGRSFGTLPPAMVQPS